MASAGDRQGRDQRTGSVGWGAPRSRSGRVVRPRSSNTSSRFSSAATPTRSKTSGSQLRQLVLAERSGALQRDERRRHGALGHQGQARRDAALPAAGWQVPARRRLYVHAAGRDSRKWRTARARRWSRGFRHVRVQVAIPRYDVGRARHDPTAGANEVVGPTDRERSGNRLRTSVSCRSSSSTSGQSLATKSSCCTTCTNASG